MTTGTNLAKEIYESAGSGSCRVDASIVRCGKDVVVVVGGGTTHHIGAVALAIPRPSLSDPSQISASASVLCVTGHKEDEVARNIALEVASKLDCVVTVIVGIHIDHATGDQLSEMLENCKEVIKNLVIRLES